METTRRIQLEELRIVKVIIDICNKHGLRWYGWFGTAIGAVRHNGFIPWDEDLDIALPRPDYEKLKISLGTELTKPLEVIEYAGNYRLEHIVVQNTDTTYIDRNRIKWPSWYRGIFVDVFPIDGMSSSQIVRKLQNKTYDFLNKVRNYHRYDVTACPTLKTKLV